MDDEEPNHGDGRPASGLVRVPLVLVLSEDGRDNEMAGGHPDGSDEQDGLTAESVDPYHRWDLVCNVC